MTIHFEQDWNGTEAFTLENEQIKAVVLPKLGGKTASLVLKANGFDIAAPNTRGAYKHPNPSSAFDKFDASGLDDAFPTVGASALCADKGYHYTDHGEIWRSAFDAEVDGETLRLHYQSNENPFSYTKTISLAGNQIVYDYEIRNTGGDDFPCIWTMHGLVRYEADMRLIYPPCPDGVFDVLNTGNNKALGQLGTIHSLHSEAYNFFGVPQEPNTASEYYLLGQIDKGSCGYHYPTSGTTCMIAYDSTVLPYLCFWVTAGDFRGDYNCAFEPTNGFYDSIDTALANNKLPILHTGETLAFSVSMSLSY